MNEITKVDATPIAPAPTTRAPMQKLTKAQVDVLRNTVCAGSSDDELKAFIWCCDRTGLDPFRKQIHAFINKGKLVIHTGIDGYRLIAHRSGKFQGRIGPQWCGDDGKWVDVWLKKEPPAAARVGVKHADCVEPFWGVATYASFARRGQNGQPYGNWVEKADVMLAKCAESAAYRAAFPEDCSGIYSEDEVESIKEDPSAALLSVRQQIEDGIARLKDRDLAAKATKLYRGASDKRDLEGVLGRVKVELARQADAEAAQKSSGGGEVTPLPRSPISSPPPASSTAPVPNAGAPVAAGSDGAQGERAPSPTPAPAPSTGAPEEHGDAWEPPADEVEQPPKALMIPNEKDVLALIGETQKPHYEALVKACAHADAPATVAGAFGNLLAARFGERVVHAWWLEAGGEGAAAWIKGRNGTESNRRLVSARELVLVLELAAAAAKKGGAS